MKLPGNTKQYSPEGEQQKKNEFRSADITTDGFPVFINFQVRARKTGQREKEAGKKKKKRELGRSIGCCWQQIKTTTATTYSSIVALWMTAITQE